MKILQLCKKIPYPLKDGESIAIHYLSKGLVSQGCSVDLLAFNTKKHFVEYTAVPDELMHYSFIQKVFLDTTVRPLALLLNLATSKSYNIQRFINQQFKEILIGLLQSESYDLVQLETLYMAPYLSTIKEFSNAKVVMRSHNLESEIWTNLSVQATNILKKQYFRICAERLHDFEQLIQNSYDLLLPISKVDGGKYLQNNYKGEDLVTPIGLDLERYIFSENGFSGSKLKMGYIGSLDWKPNVEGVDWFISEVWEGLNSLYPELEFHLAGRNPGNRYLSVQEDNFTMHGEVDDALAFVNRLDLMIVPLFSGSGMRVKILECMALGKVVLSTRKGFEGIPVENGKNCFVFDSKEELISAVRLCVSRPDLVEEIRRAGRSLVEHNFDYKIIAKNVLENYNQLIFEE